MRALTYTSAFLAFASAVAFTAVIYLPTWNAYVASASIDFSHIDPITGNYMPNYTTSTYHLRDEVVIFAWISAISFLVYGLVFDHDIRGKRYVKMKQPTPAVQGTLRLRGAPPPVKEIEAQSPDIDPKDSYYEKYAGAFWIGLALATLLESYVVSVICGINTIALNLLTGVIGAFVCVLIGPVHNRLNRELFPSRREWIAYTLGVITFVVYTFLTLIYLIEAQVIGPGSAPWTVWAIVFGDWACKAVIIVAQYFFWTRASRFGVVVALFLAHLFATLWLPWMFFARTYTYTP